MIPAVRIIVDSTAVDTTVADSMEAAAVGIIDFIVARLTGRPAVDQLTVNQEAYGPLSITILCPSLSPVQFGGV
jgi:hypothetical protein